MTHLWHYVINTARVLESDVTDARPAKVREIGSNMQCVAEVPCDTPDIGSFGTHNTERRLRQCDVGYLNLLYFPVTMLQLDFLTFTRKLISPFAPNPDGRMHRRKLLEVAGEGTRRLIDRFVSNARN